MKDGMETIYRVIGMYRNVRETLQIESGFFFVL